MQTFKKENEWKHLAYVCIFWKFALFNEAILLSLYNVPLQMLLMFFMTFKRVFDQIKAKLISDVEIAYWK